MASPNDEELQNCVRSLKAEHPTLGIPKLHAQLRKDFPQWTVSEKRLRKVLAMLAELSSDQPHPTSKVVDGLDVSHWSPRVEVCVFDAKKGKGLVAKEKIKNKEAIWVEDPFIIAPEWEIYDKIRAGTACSHCTTLFAQPSDARARCGSIGCPAAFCNILCRKRAMEKTHPILCPAQNPASLPLLRWARTREWLAVHALTQCAARLVVANNAGSDVLAADWAVFRACAALGMEHRAKSIRVQPDHTTWREAFGLFCAAFHRPSTTHKPSSEEKRVASILQKPLPEEIETALFDYDKGFLLGLGRMSLNLEAHGGLYTLHAHLNHSCTPNVSVRHLDQRKALSRITLKALADIGSGKELFISYVNPTLGYAERRNALAEWGFVCQCKRCLEEARDWKPPEQDDLESELKAGFGVM
ncbi:Set-like protein [Mycena indigotica]|uniref:Histone-lysine N-methyltransferase SET5 n=1 Tax=Mycena indigotica TaxID=2126181 RepID=A0A8H6THF3_9AGAR|nr:Set-like protein [Mycena indigotica]KAF7315805.1 Set-like protein [Mycena indigotica]